MCTVSIARTSGEITTHTAPSNAGTSGSTAMLSLSA